MTREEAIRTLLSISGKWVRNGVGWTASEITHWQPMPEPPKED